MQIQANPKLGYYEVDGFITYSKSQAFLLASKTQKMPRWNFNDKVFERFDWKTEPPGDLYDWYGVRARQIRESFDYIMIFFSGGSDSQTLVNSFLDNGLFIDEIVTLYHQDLGSTKNINHDDLLHPQNLDLEIRNTTIPAILDIQRRSPNTKITNKNVVKDTLDYWQSGESENFLNHVSEPAHPMMVTMWKSAVTDSHQKLFDTGKKVAVIFGTDKAQMIYFDDRYHLYFLDTISSVRNTAQLEEYSNVERVYFYWTPDCPQIVCKQGHLMMRYYEQHPEHRLWISGHENIGRFKSDIDRITRSIIYPRYPKTFQLRKPRNLFGACENYQAFMQDFQYEKNWDKWYQNLIMIQQNIDPKFLNIKNNVIQHLVGMCSPFYELN